MQFPIDSFSQRPTDALDLGDVIDARAQYPSQAAKARQQIAPSLGTDAADLLKTGCYPLLVAPLAVSGNGEPVRLITNLLDEMQCRPVYLR